MEKEYQELLDKSTVLLVEDNTELRVKFKTILDTYVECVYEASNGEEAIEMYNLKKPSFIITDFKLPKIDGLEFVSYIRKTNKDIPIIVISAYTQQDALIKFVSMNLVQYLTKPIDFDNLNRVLEETAQKLMDSGLIEVRLTDSAKYSFSQKAILRDGENIALTPNEIKFLELLIENKRKMVSMEMIEYEVYENDIPTDSALSNLVSKLRKKIGQNIIRNIPKTGFVLVK